MTKWRSDRTHYDWKSVEKYTKRALSVYKGPKPDVVIGLSRGGWVPATIAAQYFSVRKLYSIGLYSYHDDTNIASSTITQYQSLPGASTDFSNKIILMVDDISDKGKTFKYATKLLRDAYKCDIKTMCIVVKEGTEYKPDFYYKLEPDDKWIVFPWEE